MKILTGTLKGRTVQCPPHIRPVSSRVRKACFDIIGDYLQGTSVLDLFAGSGALGIESLSWEAGRAVFVDIKRRNIEVVKKNIYPLKLAQKSRLYVKDAFKAIKDFHARGEQFDLIFLDPPYYQGMVRKALQNLEEYDIVTPLGFIVGFSSVKDEYPEQTRNFTLTVRRHYGQTLVLMSKKRS